MTRKSIPPWPRCSFCGELALSVSPGNPPLVVQGIVLTRDVPQVAVCHRHALEIGWPWKSEQPAPRRRRRAAA